MKITSYHTDELRKHLGDTQNPGVFDWAEINADGECVFKAKLVVSGFTCEASWIPYTSDLAVFGPDRRIGSMPIQEINSRGELLKLCRRIIIAACEEEGKS